MIVNVQKMVEQGAWYLRESVSKDKKNISVRTNKAYKGHGGSLKVSFSDLDDLQVVARHQARMTAGVGNLSFPPTVVLKADYRQDIAFGEAKLLRDGSGVAVHCASYKGNGN